MDTIKAIVVGFFVLILILGATWIAQGNDFFMYKWFAPKHEQVRRETFEQSKAYNQGMIQELENMHGEYIRATPEQKSELSSLILHRAADYPIEKMPLNLRKFIESLQDDAFNPTTQESK